MARLAYRIVLTALALGLATGAFAASIDPVGLWASMMKTPDGDLRTVYEVSRNPDGSLHVTEYCPDQGEDRVPVDSFTIADGMLRIRVRAIGGRFEGKLNAEGTEAVGEWKQPGGPPLPETLVRVEKVPGPSSNPWRWPKKPNRPQTPTQPYPYAEEEVSYENAAAGVKLASTLTYPKSGGPFPAVLLIAGSGPLDRDSEAFGHKLFLILADYLTRRGIAVLRADKRGVGGSTGDGDNATTMDFVGDALAGVAYLKTRKEIDPRRMGLVGHSEGANVAPIAATRSSDVAFLVLLAPSGVTGDQIALAQDDQISRDEGTPEDRVAKQHAERAKILAIIMQEKDNAVAEQRIRGLITARYAAMTNEEKKAEDVTSDSIDDEMEAAREYLSPWSRFFLSYDPAPILTTVKVSALVMWGSKDLQAPPEQNRAPVEEALKASGCSYKIEVLPGLNHPFQTATTGTPAEYRRIEETMSPTAMKLIGDWIVETIQQGEMLQR
jgi:hypothetical protein